MNWEELRTCGLIAEQGTLMGAARALGINHSTVFRRLQSLEEQVGEPLFVRYDGAYLPTPMGERILKRVREMGNEFVELTRDLQAEKPRIEGRVRLTTTDSIAQLLLPVVLKNFHAAHPAIRIGVQVTNRQMKLELRESDVAIRSTLSPDERTMGKRVGNLQFSLFASEGWCKKNPEALKNPFAKSIFVAMDDTFEQPAFMKVFRNHIRSSSQIIMTCDSLATVMSMVEGGVGAAFLPYSLVEMGHVPLRALTPPEEIPKLGIWVLVHPDMVSHLPVRVFLDFLYETLPPLLREAGR